MTALEFRETVLDLYTKGMAEEDIPGEVQKWTPRIIECYEKEWFDVALEDITELYNDSDEGDENEALRAKFPLITALFREMGEWPCL